MNAADGVKPAKTTRRQLRRVADGSTNETLSEALGVVRCELLSIHTTLFLTDAALGTKDGWDPAKMIESAQCQLTDLRDRLSVAAEELERLAGVAGDMESAVHPNA